MNHRLQHILLLALLLLQGHSLWAQARKVLIAADEKGVWVRWTMPDLKSKSGVFIYRQETGASDWQKLNTEPLKYGSHDITAATTLDQGLQRAKDLSDGIREKDKLEGIGLAMVLVNAIESREFSRYLGILYYDQTAVPGKEYTYEVREIKGGAEVSVGKSVAVKAGKFVPEPGLKEIRTLEGDGKLFFGWNVEAERLVGANIYYKIGNAGAWKRMNDKLLLPSEVPGAAGQPAKYPEWIFSADSLLNGTTYTCMLKGVDNFGFETQASDEFKLTPRDKTAPPQAGKVDMNAAADKVTLTWEMTNTKGCDGFHIYRKTGTDSTWQKITKSPLPVTARKYEDIVEELGQVYTYSIASFDKAGNENRTSERFVRVFDTKAPVQVRGLKAVADTGVIKLTWFPNLEKDLRGYTIFRIAKTEKGGDTIQLNTQPVLVTAYNDTLPKVAKNAFSYLVSATDTNFNTGIKSAPVTAVLPDPEPPQTPFIKIIRNEGEALRIVWLPGMDIDLVGYNIYRSITEKPVDTAWHALTPRPLAGTDTAYTDRNLEAGQRYYYALVAIDKSGNVSPRSESFAGSVTVMKLRSAPQQLSVKSGRAKGEAKASWEISPNPDVIGCMLYRKQGKDDYKPVSGLLTTNEFVDKGLKPGNTYYYEVKAFDKAGNTAKSAPAQLTIEAE